MRRQSSSDASNGVNSHLCGLMTIESARSQPANGARRSGSRATTPAYAAVDVQPQTLALGDVGDRGDGVDGGARRRPDGRHDRDRAATRGPVGGDRGDERIGAHLVVVVHGHADQPGSTEPERHARLLDRAVRLGRGVDAQRGQVRSPGQAMGRGVDPGGLPCPGQGDERGRRRRVREQAAERFRQPDRLAQPVDDDLLELRADRRGPPEHRVLAEGRREHLAEDARPRCRGREVRKEARVLPMRGVGFDEAPVVREDRLERLGVLWRLRREERSQ